MSFRPRTSNGSPAHIGSLAISCGGDSNEGDFTVTDSAGITIVENGAALLNRVPTWTVNPNPTLTIESESEAGLLLFDVSEVAVLNGGTLAVTNSGGTEVLLFSQDGAFLRSIGGPGEGPGEFRTITSVVPIPGDSIGIYDSSYKRLTVFDAEGLLGREVSLREIAGGFDYTWVQSLGPSGLALLNRGGFQSAQPEGAYRTYTEWLRIDLDGHSQSSYGEFPGNELFQNARSMGSPLFSFMTAAATFSKSLVAGTGDVPEVSVYGPDGAPIRIIRWPHEPQPVTEDTLSVFLEKGLATVPEAARGQARAMMESMPKKDFIPPYSTIFASSDGLIWIGSYDGLGVVTPLDRPPERSWLVFDSRGILIARVRTPEGFRAHTVQETTLLGVYKDEMMVESIRAYRFSDDSY